MIGTENTEHFVKIATHVNAKTPAAMLAIFTEFGDIKTFTAGGILELNGLAHHLSGQVHRITAPKIDIKVPDPLDPKIGAEIAKAVAVVTKKRRK